MRRVTARIFAQRWFDPACRPDKRTLHCWVEEINRHGCWYGSR